MTRVPVVVSIAVLGIAATAILSSAGMAQDVSARGAPVLYSPEMGMRSGPSADPESWGSQPGEAPEGVEPLPIDLFTSQDFYQDSEYWTDNRYYRCIDPGQIEALWAGEGALNEFSLEELPWGNCDSGATREAIVSPYPFETAQEHWEALRAEADGGTEYTAETLPDWDGVWVRQYGRTVRSNDVTGPGGAPEPVEQTYPYWMWTNAQSGTLVSLLTEEYQQRMVQDLYHDAVNNVPQWPLQYCWPEGFMRWWSGTIDPIFVLNTPQITAFLGQGVGSSIRTVFNDREFNTDGAVPRMADSPPRWYGESIGFWDDDSYIVWTSNVQEWTSHQLFEFSPQMQSIEIYTEDEREDGLWLTHETIFYDPVALVEPVRLMVNWKRLQDINEGRPYTFNECMPTIFPIDGDPQQINAGTTIEFTVPDYFGRPWANILEQYFEQDMVPPEEESIFGNFD